MHTSNFQSDYLIQVVDTNSHTNNSEDQISWLHPHCLQSRAYPGSARPGLNCILVSTDGWRSEEEEIKTKCTEARTVIIPWNIEYCYFYAT